MTSRKGDPDLFNTPRDPNPYLKAPPPPGPAPGSATFPFSYFKVAIITYIGAERRGSRIFRIFWNRVPVVWPAGFGKQWYLRHAPGENAAEMRNADP